MKNQTSRDARSRASFLKIGQTVNVAVRDLNLRGQGVGVIISDAQSAPCINKDEDSRAAVVFVDGLIPGDEASVRLTAVRANYAVGEVTRLTGRSSDRIEPFCKLASTCGGCASQNMSYDAQLLLKANRVRNDLERIGRVDRAVLERVTRPVIGMAKPHRYRNKVQFPVGQAADGSLEIGFYAPASHEIVDGQICEIGHPAADVTRRVVRGFMVEHGLTGYDEQQGVGLVRHILTRVGFQTGQVMVVLVLNRHVPLAGKEKVVRSNSFLDAEELGRRLSEALLECGCALTSFYLNYNDKRTNRVLGEKFCLVEGAAHIEEELLGIRYRISPESFFQVNSEQTEALYQSVLEAAELRPEDVAFDLYCGTGSISLLLAGHCKRVIGNEVVERAVLDARDNAALNGIQNVEFHVGPAEVVIPRLYREGIKGNVVVLDPPRKGCDGRLLETVLEMEPRRIVYVSCNPATLARDVKVLIEGGYEPDSVCPVDMFPWTSHVETVVLMSRNG